MNRNAWIILGVGLALIIGLYLYARSAPQGDSNLIPSPGSTTTPPEEIVATSTESTVRSYGQVKIRLGERMVYPEGYIKIISVEEDSRCATGVQCIWAGTVKTTLEYSLNNVVKKETLELNKSITRGSEKISLISVEPANLPSSTIKDSDYIFTVQVTKVLIAPKPISAGPCYVGGCSGQICSDKEGAISTCEYREEYSCYKTAKCERQTNGQCGWTKTPELEMCLANAG